MGETLTAVTTGIMDADGLASVSYTYQWIRVDSGTDADIAGATSSTYTLVAADEGTTIKVKVSFTDDASNAETRTSVATGTVAEAQGDPEEPCPGGGYNPTPVAVAVTAVPIVVASTTADYFVLYVRHTVGETTTVEVPVLVTLGKADTTTLAENVEALPGERYRVEKYLIADPADVDGDCVDDITELGDPVGMNPVNPAPAIAFSDGAVAIPDRETFETLAFHQETVKFVLIGMDTDRPGVYFSATDTHRGHPSFLDAVGIDRDQSGLVTGWIVHDSKLVAPDGSQGVYYYQLLPRNTGAGFSLLSRSYTLLAASMPLLDENLALHISNDELRSLRSSLSLYRESRIALVFDDDVLRGADFLALNPGEGFGLLRSLDPDERPTPRDVVIYETLPNNLPRVAGIISTVPQTPLSHVNLRAVQDGIPNAFIRNALEDTDIEPLIGSYVHYTVTQQLRPLLAGSPPGPPDGWALRAATLAQVEAHYAASRPSQAQTPEFDLSVTGIKPLSEIGFEDWKAFGVKAANVAVLGTLGFPAGTVPAGFAIPFYFYDEFMKHNDFYTRIDTMLADPDFQSKFDTQDDMLDDLRDDIKDAETPPWIIAAIVEMNEGFSEGINRRYRSSTNNEDLPGFNGAGLYDSKSQKPSEDEDDLAKSLKEVYASLWNFRAFIERDFHRIDHKAAAMGVLVHPSYQDELANGVAVSFDPIYGGDERYYVNTQLGEDLVTNPDAQSVPEEILLHRSGGNYSVLATSNQVPPGQLLMRNSQLNQLADRLTVIHDHFKALYNPAPDEPFAMEIEFKITSEDILAIKQARPWVFDNARDAPSPPPPPPANTPATGAPTITGTARVGETLTAATTGIMDADGLTSPSYTYQWIRVETDSTETDISGATSSTYTVVTFDEGTTIKVKVTFTDDASNAETRTSAATATVAAANTPATGAPTITGTARVDEALTAVTTGIMDADGLTSPSYAYQWIRVETDSTETDISGATSSTYTVVTFDEGTTIKVRVSFTDDASHTETRTSAATATVAAANSPATGAPTITGTARVGETLTAVTTGIMDADGLTSPSYTYQWIRVDSGTDADISGATSSTYTLVAADEGTTIKVKVSFTDDDGDAETRTSAATATVAAANSPATGAPTITGTAQVGQTLTAVTTGIMDADGLTSPSYTYQWIRVISSVDADISGATSSTYTLVASDEGTTIKVRVSFTDDASHTETRTSAATATVAAATTPTISAVAVTSTPQLETDTYGEGEEIQFTVAFSEAVTVTGMPQFVFSLGNAGDTRRVNAGYDPAASTDTELVFAYTVVSTDEDDNGIFILDDATVSGTAGSGSIVLGLDGSIVGKTSEVPASLAHSVRGAQSGHKVDGVRPSFLSAAVDGASLTLTYDEPLDGSSTPDAGDFTVSGGDYTRTVTRVSVSGSTVALTLNVGAEHLETGIQVSYTPGMERKRLRDVPGNEALGLSREPVTNDTPDTTSPTVSSLVITSNPGGDQIYAAGEVIEVTVTFSETVEVTGTPQLRLRVGSRTRTAGYLRGTDTAALVFGYEVAEGESDTDGVGVEADSLTGGTIRDGADNNALLSHDGLAADARHKVDGVRPSFLSAAVDGASLTLTYDEPLDGSSTPDAGDFTVTGGDQARTVTGVSVSGSAVMLTLSAGAEHEEAGIQVSYTPGMKPLRDVPGNEAQSLSREAVTNDTPDTTPPEVSSVAISSNPGSDQTYAAGDEIELTVTFSETVEVEGTPQLRLRVGSRNRTAGYLRGTDTAVLVFGYEVADGDEDTGGLSIEAGRIDLNGGKITDKSDNNADLEYRVARTRMGHRVDGVRPEFLGAAVDGAALTLTYGEGLDAGSRPASGDFTVTGGDQARTVTGVSVSGSAVMLTLSAGAEHEEAGIQVSYTPGMKPLRDVPGNEAQSLSREAVTNNTPDTTPPEVSSVAISSNPGSDRTYAAGDEIEVMVTFSETVEVEGTPQLRLELGGGTRTATYEGGTGTAALVFAYEVADGESDTDGVGVEEDSLSGGTIRDEARNSAKLDHEGLAADSGHKVDAVKPQLAASGGAVVNETTLTLTYDEPLDGSSTPDAGDFTVSGGDYTRTVTRVSVSGSTVALTLNVGAEHLETGIQVSYTPGMERKRLRDVPGNEAQSLSREAVTNETPDTTPPEVESVGITSNPGSDQTYAAGDEIEVTVTFSERVRVTGTPQLTLRVGTRNRTAGYLRGTDTAVLVFGYEVVEGDEDVEGVSIRSGRIALNGGTIEDEAENPAELAYRAVLVRSAQRVDGVRPAFVSAAVDGASLTLTYGEALDGGSEPASGEFTVTVGGSGRTVAGVLVSGSTVTLTLDPAVEHGDTGIRVSYTPGANPIQDEVGNDAQALSNRSVTNTTGAPNTDPEITSSSSFNVPENQLVARRLAARDTDPGDEVTGWEIVGGADQSQFSMASDTGELSFQTPPDYEDPTDEASTDPPSGAGDNEYVVTVEMRSGAGARELEAEQTFTIRVTDEREPPEVPEAPVISGETADSLTVSWSEPENTGPPITDYDVQYREKGTGRFIDGDQQGPGRTLTLSDLEPGTVYEVQVRATNDEGTSDWSESGEGMTVTPLTLEMMAMEEPPVSGAFTVRFSFSEPVTGFFGNDVDSERDPECTDDQNNTVFCDPGIGGLQTADDRVFTTTVTPGTDRVAHSYTLTLTVPGGAVRSSVGSKPNEEPEEPLEVRVSPPGVEEPISSLGLRTSGGNGTVRLSWNLPSDNGGSAIIRYEHRYQAVGEGWSDWENVGAGTSGVMVGNLINGREYVFEVRAVNALGKGGAETVQATPERRITPRSPPPGGGGGGGGGGGLLFPPGAPASLMAMAGEGAVRLEWSPPESDGGTPILRYEYRLKEGRGEFGEWIPIADSAPDEVNAAGYTVEGLGNGTVYVFELRAVNLVGEGPVSEAVEAVMGLDRAYGSNFLAGDLQGGEASLERGPFGGGPQSLRLRFGAGLRFEESELDGEGEVTETRLGSYGYRYTSRTTGELSLDHDGGEACEVRLTFSGEGAGSYSYRCGGALRGQGSFRLTGLNRGPEVTSTGPFEVVENQAMVGQLEAVDRTRGTGSRDTGSRGERTGGCLRWKRRRGS